MKGKIKILIYMLTLIFINPQILFAADNIAQLGVSARVLPFFSVKNTYQAESLQISKQDVARGYIEVRAATVFEVRSNIKRAYVLSFAGRSDFYEKVWIMDGNRKIIANDNTVLIHQISSGFKGGEIKSLSYRFFLSSDTKPGSYLWPIRSDALV